MEFKLIPLQMHGDARGSLIALEENRNVPFHVKRVYFLFGTADGVRRGLHAHKNLNQLLIVVRGSCRIVLDDGQERAEILLENPAQGLFVGPEMWHEMYEFSPDCVLLVLADDFYDEADYIRDYEDFKRHIRNDSSAV